MDLKFLNGLCYADAEVAPASTGSGNSIYIVDRMLDNNQYPNENDGLMYEIQIGGSSSPTPTPTPAPSGTNLRPEVG